MAVEVVGGGEKPDMQFRITILPHTLCAVIQRCLLFYSRKELLMQDPGSSSEFLSRI